MAENFINHLSKILKADNRLVDEENDIQINVLRDLVNNLDSQLIELLIADDKIREKFFIQVKEVYVFKQIDFINYFDSLLLDGSYTQYANRIGLASGGKFLTDSTDYVLDFPYKDCVLEGGQSTEEGNDVYFEYDAEVNDYVEKTAKRKEIFYNNIIAKDEIDRLLEPKAFQKVVRYDVNGETIPTSFTRDAGLNRKRGLPEDTISDNLIIKGNNLLALHSLEKEFKGKIKLIYIDPPYNTGNDSFAYNDKFNHSAWLTFMYNRLKKAKDLLKDDGAIFISIDSKELSYLQNLMDNIFLKENFKNIITIKRSAISGPKVINPGVVNVSEFLIVYSKSYNWKFNRAYSRRGRDTRYGTFISNINDDYQNWKFIPLNEAFAFSKNKDLKTLKKDLAENWDEELDLFVLDNIESVIQFANLDESSVSASATEIKKKSKTEKDKVFKLDRKNKPPYYILNGKVILFYKDRIRVVDGVLSPSEPVSDIWTDVLPNDLHNEGGVDFRKGKKPEKMISRIIEIGTDEKDIILDYHLGSGTTAAVAHKMNRQYLGIEQLNYGENDSTTRLQNVINGSDDRGVSKIFNWQDGGSFIYAELAKNNETAKERIDACNSLEELVQLFDELNTRYFLDYNVRIKDFKENVVKEEAFINLSLARQKELFKRMLDNNQLYVNLSEVEDARYTLSEDAIRLTKDFYQIKN